MLHPLYYTAARHVGRPVLAHHRSGVTYCGLLYSVTEGGIYLVPQTNRYQPSSATVDADADVCAQWVYSPGWYFGFGALAGLTVGALVAPFFW